MKSITKKVVALSATFAMAASVVASAATIERVTVADGATADSITVNYESTGLASDAQATILVYTGDTPFAGGTGDNVGYINQDTASGSFTFAMRDTLVPATGTQKTYNVLVGGTDVATAGSTTFTLGEAAPAGFTATFEDDGVAAGDAIKGTKITLPAITNKSPNTRYYTGWTKDGGTTVLAAGTEVTLEADTKFTAVHFGKGDVTKDGLISGIDADMIYYAELYDEESINAAGCEKFWDTEIGDELSLAVCDVTKDGLISGIDADMVYYAELWDEESVIAAGCTKFWED